MVKSLFPLFKKYPELVYLDSAATTLKPQSVIDRITEFNSFETANVHRGSYALSDLTTTAYENARKKVSEFVGAESPDEIIFVRGTTEGVNLIAAGLEDTIKAGDEILISGLEHHANLVPWQMLAEKKAAKLVVGNPELDGSLPVDKFSSLMNSRTKIVAISGGSNTLGTMPDVSAITKAGHQVGAVVVVDAAQSVTFGPQAVTTWDCDFLVFSGHKLWAPFGIGVVYGKRSLLEKMKPYQGGGSMIRQVTYEKTTYNDLPYKYEAGTPNVEGAVGLQAALEFAEQIGWAKIHKHKSDLTLKAFKALQELPVNIYGTQFPRSSLISFNLKGAHHSDVGQILNEQNIAVRVGHLCTQPLMKQHNIPGTVRASFSVYNTEEDVDKLIAAVNKAKDLLL